MRALFESDESSDSEFFFHSSRVSFSAVGSLVFNQGVMLLLAMLRLRLPNCRHLTIPLGLGTCFGLVHLARLYGDHCDSLVPALPSPSTKNGSTSPTKASSPLSRWDLCVWASIRSCFDSGIFRSLISCFTPSPFHLSLSLSSVPRPRALWNPCLPTERLR